MPIAIIADSTNSISLNHRRSIHQQQQISLFLIAAIGIGMVIFAGKIVALNGLILSGGPDSFARYPKWAQTFDNELSFELKTRQQSALLFYTDDGAVQHNFFTVSLLDGHMVVEFRLGELQLEPTEHRQMVQIEMSETRVDDGHWHRFTFNQEWEKIKVTVDEEPAFRVLAQRSFSLGNIRTNSDVFVGGIPKEVDKLSSPLRRHSRHFAGSMRNLFYRLYPQGMFTPQLMDSIGTRKTDEDYCPRKKGGIAEKHGLQHQKQQHQQQSEYCQNGGRCYSANNGPRCDCSFSDFDGRRCEIRKPSTEVSFFGNEWIGYDLSNLPEPSNGTDGFMAIWSRQEHFNITFRTNNSDAIILLAGDSKNHVKLMLDKGVLLAQSQLAGTERRIIRVQNRSRHPLHLDDDLWHNVFLVRELSYPGLKSSWRYSMRLMVDDFFNQEVKQSTHQPWLGNSFLFIGGAPESLGQLVPEQLFPFRGCIKKAFFQSGPIQLNMIQLADQGFGQSHVQTYGDLSYSCSPNAQVPEVFSFNSGKNFTKFPAWKSPARGTIAFQFRTLAPDGLILYHGMTNCPNFTICDYLAFELIDSHLMMIINLGSGEIRLQASAKTLIDGLWHSVVMERSGRRGFITVDSLRTDFSCPGISANLDIEDPIYLGGVPWPNPLAPATIVPKMEEERVEDVTVIQLVQPNEENAKQLYFPSTVWSIGLRQGFVGCAKNIRVNGINTQIAHAFHSKLLNESPNNREGRKAKEQALSVGCPFSFTTNFCVPKPGSSHIKHWSPCKNGGKCTSLHHTFECDCANSIFDGPTCSHKSRLVQFPLLSPSVSHFHLSNWRYESENIEVKFRLRADKQQQFDQRLQTGLLVLMDTKSREGKERMLLAVLASGGLLMDWVFPGGQEKTLLWAANISADDRWHSAKIRRRAHSVFLFFDGTEVQHKLPVQGPAAISIDELSIGRAIGPHRIKNQAEHLFKFHGDLRQFLLNGLDLLKSIRLAEAGVPKQGILRFDEKSKEERERDGMEQQLEEQPQVFAYGGQNKYELYPPLSSESSPLITVRPTAQNSHRNQQQYGANDSFFTKAPLGCLKQSSDNCRPEPSPEDSFFTPVLSKAFQGTPSPPKTPAISTSTTRRASSSSTETTTKSSSSSSSSTASSRETPTTRARPSPTSSSSSSTLATRRQQSPITAGTPTPRFAIGLNDPTLNAVRPTAPMNGFSTPPTSLGPPTSTNQMGDEKKFLIGVGSLSIVVMVGAILLCVFCKRCNQICSQMAASAGAVGVAGAGGGGGPAAGMKAGYTPIPPNEFGGSPQVQQHQHPMQSFDNNGRATNVGPATSLLRNGGGNGLLGNGVTSATAGERQTRVVLANGNGGVRETTSLVNSSTAGREGAQRKRDFKEWYV